MNRLTFHLPRPMPAANDCLPHAAMNLGATGGVGMSSRPGWVARLILEKQLDNWVLYRLDANGGFVGDSWHGTLEDALWQVKKEFGVAGAGESSQ